MCFSAANVHYGHFGELLEGFSPYSQISCIFESIITSHYGKYNKLVEGLEDKFKVDADKIAEDKGEDDASEKDDN